MLILDTALLLYAVGIDHPLRQPCRDLLAAHRERRLTATTTVEVLQEFTHVCARRRGRNASAALTRNYANAFDLLTTTPADLLLGLDLFVSVESIGAFDAVLAAVAINSRAEALVTADRGFAAVPGLRIVDPATAIAEFARDEP